MKVDIIVRCVIYIILGIVTIIGRKVNEEYWPIPLVIVILIVLVALLIHEIYRSKCNDI